MEAFDRENARRLIAACLGAVLLGVPARTTPQNDSARLYEAHCGTCHGTDGEGVQGIDFHKGQFRRVASDADLLRTIVNGIPGTAMPPTNLTRDEASMIMGYVRSLAKAAPAITSPGDRMRGQALFEGKAGCTSCHLVRGTGSHFGPDLSTVGSLRQLAELEQTLRDPGSRIQPQNRLVRVVQNDGTAITGRRLNEDTLTIQLIDPNERLLSFSKSELREYTLLKTSTMPSYREKLRDDEIADIVSYLSSLKGGDGK